ncbi:MAG: SUMF1/EgtB/PvdO family nonheme iron enzyme [Magnetococcus sp. DMHC-8]
MSLLLERYVYGQSDGLFLQSDDKARVLDDMRVDGPGRYQRIIRLARRQAEVQRLAAREIANSTLEGADLLAATVVQQTDLLTTAIDQIAGQVSQTTAHLLLELFASLAPAFCLEMSEINWQLAQRSDPLDPLLEGLRNNRASEAQRLLTLGVTHCMAGEQAKATEPLRRALAHDDTDYQILMNLGYHAIHRGDGKMARSLFERALGLINRLDNAAQGQLLWAVSRLCYAQADHANACLFARRAYGKSRSVQHLFLAACYAALANRWDEARDEMERAIRMDVRCLTRAVVEPALVPVRKKWLVTLAMLSQQHRQALSDALKVFAREIGQTLSLVQHPLSREVLHHMEQEVTTNRETPGSHAEVVERLTAMPACQAMLAQVRQYDGWLTDTPDPPADERQQATRLLQAVSMAGMRQALRRRTQGMRCPLTGMALVWVPEGAFRMGDGSGADGQNAGPVHEVRLDGFWLGKYPVTQGEWKKVMGSNLSHFKRGDRYPVESVAWEDVQEFLQKLNERRHGTYRLPTEAEWEYACRSGGQDEIYSGSNNADTVAWHQANSGERTHPVGQKAPNGLGLHDMSGNVWEWVADWYDATYYAHSPRCNPQGPAEGTHRIKRGGSWGSRPETLRATFRYDSSPDGWYDDLGFRLLREAG